MPRARAVSAALLVALALAAGPARAEPTPPLPDEPNSLTAVEQSYALPALEVVTEELVLQTLDRASGASFAQINAASVRSNLRTGFTWDNDLFATNQILHPYQGALYFTAARSSGLSFWRSAPYTFLGSLLWEYAMETQPPSINDQITTSAGGVLVGETLFRLSRQVLAYTGSHSVGGRLAAAALDVVGATNDLVFGDRFHGAVPEPTPFAARLTLGGWVSAVGARRLSSVPPSGRVAFQYTQGGPEQGIRQPFDYFDLSAELAANDRTPSLSDPKGMTWALLLRGMLAGRSVEGANGQGLAGLFGLFDFTGPTATRTAATGFGPGAVWSWDLNGARLVASAVGAASFGTTGALAPKVEDRDYRYDFGATGVMDTRLRAGPVELRATANGTFTPQAMGGGPEAFAMLSSSLAVQIYGPHALALDGSLTRRAAWGSEHLRERWAAAGLSYLLRLGD